MSDFPFDISVWNRYALLTCGEMQRAEQTAFARGIPSFSIMQRAGEAVARAVQEKWKPCRILVLCGPGNNGGDGFVIAEALRRAGWDVALAAMCSPESLKGDAMQAAKNWQGKTETLENASFENVDLVVDALFGTGLERPLEGVACTVLEKLKLTKIPVVAVDMPSGIDGNTGHILGTATQAKLTVTFFRKKIGHLLLPGATLCGEVVVADIGVMDDVLDDIRPQAVENNPALWCRLFPFPKAEGHKYTRGHALIYGGAVMTGAARLAVRAAQRMGAGLVTLGAPPSALPIYAEALESVIVQTADSREEWKSLLADPKRNAVLIGPGLGTGSSQAELVLEALETRKPCVLDADALSNFAAEPEELLARLHDQCVLTPHEGEFTRLFGGKVNPSLDKLTRAGEAAKISNSIILLKGADTVIATPQGVGVINGNAPPWLATAGAGDVLAGMIVGLLAQGMPGVASAAASAWIHGQIAANFGPGLIAEDLISGLPAVLKSLSARADVV